MDDILQRFEDLTPRRFAAGAALIAQGGEEGSIVVLKSGTVTVRRDGVEVASVAEPGAVFGEMSLLLERPHTASVVAATSVEAYIVEDGFAALQSRPGLAVHVAGLIAQRLESTTGYVGRLKQGAVEKRHDTSVFERLIGFLTGQPPGGKPAPRDASQPRPR